MSRRLGGETGHALPRRPERPGAGAGPFTFTANRQTALASETHLQASAGVAECYTLCMHYDDRMPSLQIRDMPEQLYEDLGERARERRRSLAQQAVVELSEKHDAGPGRRRRELVAKLRERFSEARRRPAMRDPVKLVREDRSR